jgi:SAM-dependent methyltransferase
MAANKNMNCLLCGKATQLLESNFPGYQEPEKFGIYYCASCNTSFSYPRVDTKHIYENIYRCADKLPGYDRYVKYRDTVKVHKKPLQFLSQSEETYWGVKRVLEQDAAAKKSLRIIEIGCGLGYLTYSLVQDGYCAVGLDISQNAIDEASKNFGSYYICADISQYAEQHKGAYDIAILTEVIEHVENPISFLKSAMLLISNDVHGGGKIVLTTPNKTIYAKNIAWETDLPPVHFWWFSEDSMRYIAGKLNAEVQFVDFSDYYKENSTRYIDVKRGRNTQEIKHVFGRNGEVVINNNVNNNKLSSKLRSFVAKLPFAKHFYHKIKRSYISGKRGWVLGVVIQSKTAETGK